MCKLMEFIYNNNKIDLLDAHLEEKYTYYTLGLFYYATKGDNWISNNS